LYYIYTKELFAFSSEASALSKVFPQIAVLNPGYLSNYLAHGYVNNNVELFKTIDELPPSCFLSLNNGKLQTEKYWTYTEKFINKTGDSFSKAVQNVDNLITDSVREQIQTSDVQVRTLDSFDIKNSNMLVIDAQGYELEVLKGASKTLESVHHVFCEVNLIEMYEGCPTMKDISNFLSQYGFSLRENWWTPNNWGDAYWSR
jgi:hypothetical protein